jgi:hypothetical protein
MTLQETQVELYGYASPRRATQSLAAGECVGHKEASRSRLQFEDFGAEFEHTSPALEHAHDRRHSPIAIQDDIGIRIEVAKRQARPSA